MEEGKRLLLSSRWYIGRSAGQPPEIETLELGILVRWKPGHEDSVKGRAIGQLHPDDPPANLQTDAVDVTKRLDRGALGNVPVQAKPAAGQRHVAQGPAKLNLLLAE